MASALFLLAQIAGVPGAATWLEAATIASLASALVHAISARALVLLAHLGATLRLDAIAAIRWRSGPAVSGARRDLRHPQGGRGLKKRIW